MKKLIFPLFFFIPFYLFGIDIVGDVKLTKSWYIIKDNWSPDNDAFNTLDITVNDSADDNIKFKAGFQLRYYDYENITNTDNLKYTESDSFILIPKEIWLEIYDIPFENISFKVGKQLFEWGTADGIHPASVLNPDDFSNPFVLSKIPVWAADLSYILDPVKISGIWIPQFSPARLPGYFKLFDYSSFQQQGILISGIKENIKMPVYREEFAAHIDFSLDCIDFSLGYFKGYDYIMSAENLIYTMDTFNKFFLNAVYTYPELKVYTFDAATSIAGAGFWFEAGIYDYNKESMSIITPSGKEQVELFSGKPYASYIFGSDYSFENGFYLNIQYSYGLGYTRGENNLTDYILLLNKYTLFDIATVELMNTFEWNRRVNIKNNYGYMLSQSLNIELTDNFSLDIIMTEIDGYGKVLFKNWKEYDNFTFEFKYSF